MSSFAALSRLCGYRDNFHASLTASRQLRLAVIAGTVINKVYPIQGISRAAKQTIMAECEAKLDQWYLSLPDYLRFDLSNRDAPCLPQVMFLHVRYWGCVLLLYRAL
jgi:hypothetical protein